jgi:hypothetical protein
VDGAAATPVIAANLAAANVHLLTALMPDCPGPRTARPDLNTNEATPIRDRLQTPESG